jgi:hypothetical protein
MESERRSALVWGILAAGSPSCFEIPPEKLHAKPTESSAKFLAV